MTGVKPAAPVHLAPTPPRPKAVHPQNRFGKQPPLSESRRRAFHRRTRRICWVLGFIHHPSLSHLSQTLNLIAFSSTPVQARDVLCACNRTRTRTTTNCVSVYSPTHSFAPSLPLLHSTRRSRISFIVTQHHGEAQKFEQTSRPEEGSFASFTCGPVQVAGMRATQSLTPNRRERFSPPSSHVSSATTKTPSL